MAAELIYLEKTFVVDLEGQWKAMDRWGLLIPKTFSSIEQIESLTDKDRQSSSH